MAIGISRPAVVGSESTVRGAVVGSRERTVAEVALAGEVELLNEKSLLVVPGRGQYRTWWPNARPYRHRARGLESG